MRLPTALALLGLVAALPLEAQEPVRFTVSADMRACLKVRARPESDAPVIACLDPGTEVEVIGIAPYWRQIRFEPDETGWAAKKFLEIVPEVLDSIAADSVAEPANLELEIHVVDVGQGDGIWIHTPDDNVPGNGRYEGYNIIIDGGPRDATRPFLRYLMAQAHRRAVIDALIITHPHVDHYVGALGILDSFEVREFYDSGYPKTGSTWRGFLEQVDQERYEGQPTVKHIGRAAFGTPDWGSELQVRFLYAHTGRAGFGSDPNTKENNASIVLRIQYGTQSMLLMGDAEGKNRDHPADSARYAERFLLDSLGASALRSTVLKIGHHGSETSSTVPFIRAVDPDYLVVSSGRENFNGTFLPRTSTLGRYCTHKPGTLIYRTDQDDEAEGRTESTDADGDHVIVTMTPTRTTFRALSAGTEVTPTACVP